MSSRKEITLEEEYDFVCQELKAEIKKNRLLEKQIRDLAKIIDALQMDNQKLKADIQHAYSITSSSSSSSSVVRTQSSSSDARSSSPERSYTHMNMRILPIGTTPNIPDSTVSSEFGI